jgi:XTP/dITP diphosphohydrolase
MDESVSEILVATGNKGKISEIAQILEDLPIRLISLADMDDPPDLIEDGDTFEQNAEKKAWTVAKRFNIVSMADDSGICVDALQGGPGVFSARYGGEGLDDEKRRIHLLREMAHIPETERTARFVCVICLAWPDGRTIFFRGECEGVIVFEPKGEGGFGYDPVFYYEPAQKTFAEMAPEEKNLVSHRYRALQKMKECLESLQIGSDHEPAH